MGGQKTSNERKLNTYDLLKAVGILFNLSDHLGWCGVVKEWRSRSITRAIGRGSAPVFFFGGYFRFLSVSLANLGVGNLHTFGKRYFPTIHSRIHMVFYGIYLMYEFYHALLSVKIFKGVSNHHMSSFDVRL